MSIATGPRPSPVRASMFRISHVLGAHREYDRRCIAEIQALFEAAFPDLAGDNDYIAQKLTSASTRGYPTVLLAAHGSGDRVIGFALADYFESIGYGYLDFIVTEAERRGRGLERALFEAVHGDLGRGGAGGRGVRGPPGGPGRTGAGRPVPRGPGRGSHAGRGARRTQGEQDPAEVL